MINTIKHLAFTLKVGPEELDKICNHIDRYYYTKVENKVNKDGTPKLDKFGKQKTRVLNPSIKRLKVIQKRMLNDILEKLPMPDYAYGAVKNRDNVKNARYHQGNKHIFTTDLKNFFPSIRNTQVFEMFISFKFSPSVARLLTKLTTYRGKVPQGAPTSPTIANLVFMKTGKKLQSIATDNKLKFTSFIDDLSFSGPVDHKHLGPQIIGVIHSDGYKINHSKTNYKTKNPIITGAVVKNNSLGITPSLKEKISNSHLLSKEQQLGLQLYVNKVLNS
jgi:RNA-directed DNA polymerase